jgi:hypothetical protein
LGIRKQEKRKKEKEKMPNQVSYTQSGERSKLARILKRPLPHLRKKEETGNFPFRSIPILVTSVDDSDTMRVDGFGSGEDGRRAGVATDILNPEF